MEYIEHITFIMAWFGSNFASKIQQNYADTMQ